MSNKWLQREGPVWVEKKIITQEQYEEILKLYPESRHRITQVLPILASVLIGLSLLTFVASNWDGLSHMARLVILLLTMVGFYVSGFQVYRKGHPWVGQGLLGLGVISFGASMILIGQMFHLIAYDARIFVLWSLAGLSLLYLYRRYLFFLLSSALMLAGQIYAMVSFGEASGILLALTILGLGIFAYRATDISAGWILAFLIGIQSIFLLISEDVAWSWVSLVPLVLYVIGVWLGERPIAQGFLTWPPAFSFAFSTFMVFVHDHAFDDPGFMARPVPYLFSFFVLLLLAIWKSRGEQGKWMPFILFLPLFYLSYGDLAYLAVMFLYSSFLIYFGDREEARWRSKIGVFLFLFSSFVGYIQLAWDFLDKSLFFLIGGLMLFAIHWVLRRRSRWMAKGEERPW